MKAMSLYLEYTVRLYLRVITIADLTDPEGSTIPDGMLTGDWQAGSD
jgi:hypothetical protein